MNKKDIYLIDSYFFFNLYFYLPQRLSRSLFCLSSFLISSIFIFQFYDEMQLLIIIFYIDESFTTFTNISYCGETKMSHLKINDLCIKSIIIGGNKKSVKAVEKTSKTREKCPIT